MARPLLALLLLLSSVTTSLAGCGSAHTSTPVNTNVKVANCVNYENKPERIYLACGDGGESVGNITWTSWGGETATGHGTYTINDCEPDCADGIFHEKPVNVTLSLIRKANAVEFYSRMTITTNSGSLPVIGGSSSVRDLEITG